MAHDLRYIREAGNRRWPAKSSRQRSSEHEASRSASLDDRRQGGGGAHCQGSSSCCWLSSSYVYPGLVFPNTLLSRCRSLAMTFTKGTSAGTSSCAGFSHRRIRTAELAVATADERPGPTIDGGDWTRCSPPSMGRPPAVRQRSRELRARPCWLLQGGDRMITARGSRAAPPGPWRGERSRSLRASVRPVG